MKTKKLQSIHHLNRIAGQIGGIKNMLEKKEKNEKIIAQIIAAKSSLEQLAIDLVRTESKCCDKKSLDKLINLFFKIK